MNNYGLYTVDATKDIKHSHKPFNRTAIHYNGKVVNTTFNEQNKCGVYVSGNRLICSGDDVATTNGGSPEVEFSTNETFFGDAKLSNNKCINVTKADYNNLRSGREVPGYLRYNSKYVYNIVEDVSEASEVEYENIYDLDDCIYNSLAGSLAHNSPTVYDYIDIDLPTLIMRHASPIITEGEGVTIEYFVDTKYCDSINNRTIGDTFTLIITDINGKQIYKNTTYAGEFIITTDAFIENGDSILGRTWYNMKCIDSKGRCSYELSYDVYIRAADYTENLYPMQYSDLAKYNIVDQGNEYSFEVGYYNKLGFQRLINDAKNAGYNGVRIYNRKANSTSVDDSGNSKYYIDYHLPISTNPLVLAPTYEYYLIKVEFSSNNGKGSIIGIDKLPEQVTFADFADKKLVYNQSVDVDGTVYTVNKEDVFDWVKKDGAHIYRNDNDKIKVFWSAPYLDSDEVHVNDNETSTIRMLRIKSLQALVRSLTTLKSNSTDYIHTLETFFTEGEGWYYLYKADCAFTYDTRGRRLDHKIDESNIIVIPDNFTIDFNNTGFYSTEWTDAANKVPLFRFMNGTDVHLRNGKLDGNYTYASLKKAYLKLGYFGGNIGEGRTILGISGCHSCSLINMDIGNSIGYGLPTGPNSKSNVGGYVYDFTFTDLGFINSSGIFVNSYKVIKDSSNNSLLSVDAVERTKCDATDICIATTNSYFKLNEYSLQVPVTIGSIISSVRDWAGGKYDIYFIHCYNYNSTSNTYTYLKSIKTKTYRGAKLPSNTTHIKITGYGVCKDNNGVITQCIDSYTGDDYALRATCLKTFNNTTCLTVEDCRIHHTRSTALTGPAVNTLYKNCNFDHTAFCPKGFHVTSWFWDIEETLRLHDGSYFDNCNVSYASSTGFNGTIHDITSATCAENFTFKFCSGFGIGGAAGTCLDHLYIKDCDINNFYLYHYRAYGNNFQSALRRCTIAGVHYLKWSNTAGHMTATVTFKKSASDGGKEQTIQRNPCDELVNKYLTYDECIVRVPTAYGDMRAIGKYAVPKKVSGSTITPQTIVDTYQRVEEINI